MVRQTIAMAAAESVSPSSPGGSVSGGAGADGAASGGAASGGAASGGPVGIIRIDNVGIAVADLDEAIALYARVFGMTCVHVEENVEQGVREAMLQVGTAPDGG